MHATSALPVVKKCLYFSGAIHRAWVKFSPVAAAMLSNLIIPILRSKLRDSESASHAMRNPQTTESKNGFTLIELLVVIAIIAVLGVLLVPVVSRVLESSRSAVCMQNLKQLGVGMLLYGADHNARFPVLYDVNLPSGANTWYGILTTEGYLEKPIFGRASCLVCPSQLPKVWTRLSNGSLAAYGIRWPSNHTTGSASSKTYRYAGGGIYDLDLDANGKSSYYAPMSKYMIMGDSLYTGAAVAEKNTQSYYFITSRANDRVVHLRHKLRGNFLFADGHVVSLDANDLLNDPYDPTLSSQICTDPPIR